MSITEAKLLASGFTSSDLQKLRKYITKDALSLDMVISDLSRRFNAALYTVSVRGRCVTARSGQSLPLRLSPFSPSMSLFPLLSCQPQ